MEKRDVRQRLWTQVFALWNPSGAAGDCEETSHGWKQNLTIHSNRKLMRGLSGSVVCWLAVSSMPRMVSPVKSMAKLLLFLTWAGLPITFKKDSSRQSVICQFPCNLLNNSSTCSFLYRQIYQNRKKATVRVSESLLHKTNVHMHAKRHPQHFRET